MENTKAIVIGSGIAGIAVALRLRAKGYDVDVFEANAYPGGKLHAFEKQGYHFDYGPSLFTMPHFVEELFQLFNEEPQKHFNYIRKKITCNYFWSDGTTFSANGEKDIFIREASKTFNEPKEHIELYLDRSKKKYDLTAPLFLEKSLHRISSYISAETLRGLMGIRQLDLVKNLDAVNKAYFKNPRLVQLFNRYATYNGSSPYITSGIMSMIPHLEMGFGTYYPKGGMHQITQSLYKLAVDNGVTFSFGNPVMEVLFKNKKITGVLADKTYKTDLVVCNMDVFSAYQTILKKAKKTKTYISTRKI